MTIRLADGADYVEIDPERGGRICSLVILGQERIAGRPCSDLIEPGLAWGSFLMAPFVGRVSEGRLEWQGHVAQLHRNHGAHAIHGVAFDEEFHVVESRDGRVVLGARLDPRRWPFGGEVVQRYTLTARRLQIEAEVVAEQSMPAAIGWHPWFVRVPGMTVSVESGHALVTGDDLIPTGETRAVDAANDLRSGRLVDELRLDDVYVAATSPALLSWPDLDLTIGFGSPLGNVVVYIHPKAVCVEPQTAWPDAVRLAGLGLKDTGLVALDRGKRLTAAMTWSWQPK